MSDNYSTRQTRVLTTSDRSLDNIVFLHRTPPLTSEWNLINQIGNQRIQDITRAVYPSGWISVERPVQGWSESNAITGQVVCSESYATNSFKLISNNDNIAVVNGWPINVAATNSSDNNNIILCNSPTGQKYDFVFLEIWRKLVSYNESLYPYGNVALNPYSDNEIRWDTAGFESTKRVQVQYRIRVSRVNTELSAESDVFSDLSIYPIGPSIDGEYTFDTFKKFGETDIGLYVAGDGSADSQASLGTVDGYIYALPMFLIYRRLQSSSIFSDTQVNYAYTSKDRQTDGYVSDRPDGKIADIIYKDDIIDFRNKVVTSGKDLDQIIQTSFSKLIAGELTTALKRPFAENGAQTSAFSGGSTVMKVERLNSVGGDDIPGMGTGSGTIGTAFKRRAFCNAEYTHDHMVIEVPINGATWAEGTILFSTAFTFPNGEVQSVNGFYIPLDSDITTMPNTSAIPTGLDATTSQVTISDSGANSIVGTSVKLMMEFTFKYDSSGVGMHDVPKNFLEVGKGAYFPIATRDRDITLRFNDNQQLLCYGLTPNNGDIDISDAVHYAGGNYTDNSNFGHDMITYRTSNTFSKVTFSLTNSKLAGYCILGVKQVEPEDILNPGTYLSPVDFSIERNITLYPYEVSNYVVTVTGYASRNLRITLITGTKFLQDVDSNNVSKDYTLTESFKYFELSKQGKGVLDTYETIEAIAVENIVNPGEYTLDTYDKPIIALATKTRVESGHIEGYPFAFTWNTSGVFIPINDVSINQSLPVLSYTSYTEDTLPTKLRISAASGHGKLRVPVIVHSYVSSGESPYNFYYKTNPYQGILSSASSFYGKIKTEGPAIITTLGSGAVTPYTYSIGKARFTTGSRSVVGIDDSLGNFPEWLSYAQVGDFIGVIGSEQLYRVLSVATDTGITISEKYVGTTVESEYRLIRLDVPDQNISNVVDRLPTLKIVTSLGTEITDYKCYSDIMSTGIFQGKLVYTTPTVKQQDPMNTLVNDFKVGSGNSSRRGRNNFLLTDGANDTFKISSRPNVCYMSLLSPLTDGHNKKVYQAYLFNRSFKGMVSGKSGLTGRLYLMIISSETVEDTSNVFNGHKNVDTVDLFELESRPIIKMD